MRHSLIYLHSQDRLPLPFSSHPQPRSLGGFRGGGWEAQADCVGIRLLPRPLRVTAGPPGAEGVPERPHPTPGIPLVPKMPLPLGTPSPQTRWCHPRVGWKQRAVAWWHRALSKHGSLPHLPCVPPQEDAPSSSVSLPAEWRSSD